MKLSPIFTDHMVFQANKPIRVFGDGDGTVTVSFVGITVTETVGGEHWCVELPALTYGGPYKMAITLNSRITVLSDVYVGEVYLLAGQSNIEFSVENSALPKEQYEECPLVRCFMQDRLVTSPHLCSADGWLICRGDKIKWWSAIGYHMALKISKTRGIAVGLVFCYKGASVIESWLPEEIVSKPEYILPFEERYLSRSTEKNSPHNANAALYRAAQQKIVPFSFAAVVWYQGESNTGTGDYKVYGGLLRELIIRWRKDFCDENLLFVIVQIADYDARNDAEWKNIQIIQEKISAQAKNVITVRSADVCESFDIHPPTKAYLADKIADLLLKFLSSHRKSETTK